MTTPFKKRFWRLSKWFIALFVIMFVFRLLYGYFSNNTRAYGIDDTSNFFGSVENLRKNYASEKMLKSPASPVPQQATYASSQKYEKTATVKSKTSDFDSDEAKTKSLAKNFNAVIQYEQNLGNKGNRETHMLVGVPPDLFDSFYVAMQKIGIIKGTEVIKTDKTNEYRKLNAQKVSLQTTLTSLNELKSKSGQISDYISLHDKILEIERQLQELGVELGNFDTENEFCTVRFSLYEGAADKKITFPYRVKVALEWTIKYYAVLVISLLIASGVIFLLLLIVDKLNILKSISKKLEG